MTFPLNPIEGQAYATEKYLFIYEGGKWISRVADLSQVLPEQNRQEFLPPYSAVATLRTNLSCTDNKLGFSTDKVTFIDDLTVDIGDSYFVEWTSGISTAVQGSSYTSEITVNYLDIDTIETVNVQIIGVDKLPDPFTFNPVTDTIATAVVEANALAMLGSINAPTTLWGSSDSPDAEVNIADNGWQSIPTTIGTGLKIASKDEIKIRHECLTGSLTDTTTTINIGYSDQVGGFETSDFVTTNFNSFVLQPSITSPTEETVTSSITPTLIGSSFDSVGSLVHGSTDWQVASDDAFTNIIWESLNNTTDLESITTGDLGIGTKFVRVRYRDNLGAESLWSESVTFYTPFTTGSNATQISIDTVEVNSSTSLQLPTGTYLVTTWGGGGGSADGGVRGSSTGGGAGAVTKEITYGSLTALAFAIGGGGTRGTRGTNTAGTGGSPDGGDGLEIGSDFWNGGGGGARSTVDGMVAAGGGGGAGDNGNSGGNGGAGGAGTGAGGQERVANSGSQQKDGGFAISGGYLDNFSANTGNDVSGSVRCVVSFSNLADKRIDVRITATGPAGTVTEERTNVTSTDFTLNYNGDYPNISVAYRWSNGTGVNVSHDLSVTWSGVANGRLAQSGSGGSGGGGAGAVNNGIGSPVSGGEGGDNSGSFTTETIGSGNLAGDRYFSTAYNRYFGDGGNDSDGSNGGARIVKVS